MPTRLAGMLAFQRVTDGRIVDAVCVDLQVQDDLGPETLANGDLAADRVGSTGGSVLRQVLGANADGDVAPVVRGQRFGCTGQRDRRRAETQCAATGAGCVATAQQAICGEPMNVATNRLSGWS